MPKSKTKLKVVKLDDKRPLGDDYDNYIEEDSEGNTNYTEEGQEIFIDILDDFCNYIAKFGMYSEADRHA